MESSKEIVDKVRASYQFNTLLKTTHQANDPVVTKQSIVEVLAPFFENRANLERFAIVALIPELSTLTELMKYPQYMQYFQDILQTYKDAKNVNKDHFYKALGYWHKPCERALHKYWSVYHLEIEKSTLPIEEYVHESFRNVGDIIEGITQPFLRALLHIVRIRNKSIINTNKLASDDLGVIIASLIEECTFPDLFVIPPWEIRLNQCRNIAFHHTTQIVGDEIICTYGKAPNTKKFNTSREDIYIATQNIFNLFRAIKLVYSIMIIDNIAWLRYPDNDTPILRKESHLINLVLQFASQGFDVVDFAESSVLSTVRVRDLLKGNDRIRAIHSSQFLYSLWQSTESSCVVVEYENKEGLLMYRFALDSDTCRKISTTEEDPGALQAEKMTINKIVQQ